MKNKDQINLSPDELWEYCQEEYKSKNFVIQHLIKKFFERIERIIDNLPSDSRIFEIGCGAGESSKKIFGMTKGRYFESSEYDSRYIKKLNETKLPFKVTQENVYHINRENNSFDCLIMLEVLEHLEKPKEALRELFRVAKKLVIISVPNEPIWRVSNLLRGKYISRFGNTPGHINHYSKRSIQKLMEPYGNLVKTYKPFPWLIVVAKPYYER